MLSFLIHYKFIVNNYLVNSQNSFPDHVLILQSKWIALKLASWYGADYAQEIAWYQF